MENAENLPVENSNNNDPFNEIQDYKNLNVPDEPVLQGTNMIESMLNNDEVPENIRKDHWYVFHKDNVLGFLDEDRKRSKLLNFDIIKLDSLSTMRRRQYKFDTELSYDILRNVFETKLDRSLGSSAASNQMNERKSLISQISENRNVTESDESLVKEGFIKKLLGRKR